MKRTLRSLTLLGGTTLVMVLSGAGCFGINGSTFGNTSTTPTTVALFASRPPEDCGDRNPNKLEAFIIISNPNPRMDEPIRFDASCSVGRITKIEWDFDTFNGWPNIRRPVDQSLSERWHTPIDIEYVDLETGYEPRRGDWNFTTRSYNIEWDKNTLSPFYQIYAPERSGMTRARVRVTDARGRKTTASLVYTTRDEYLSPSAADSSLHPYFRIPGAANYDDGRLIYLPWNTETVGSYTTDPSRSTGNITHFAWNISGYSGQNAETGEVFFNRFRVSSTPWIIPTFVSDRNGIAAPTPSTFYFSPSGHLPSSRQSPFNQGWPSQIDISLQVKNQPNNPNPHDRTTADRNATAEWNRRDEVEYKRSYKFIDTDTNDLLYPQFDFSVSGYGTSLSGTPYYDESRHGLDQNIPQLQNSYPEGSTTPIYYPPQDTPILDPGQVFVLADYSVMRSPSRQGNVTVEFDPGGPRGGQFIPAARRQIQNYQSEPFTAALEPGTYTARMRITDSGAPPLSSPVSSIVERPYRVRQLMNLRVTESHQSPSVVGQAIRFDATSSTGEILYYKWKIKKGYDSVYTSKQYVGERGAGILEWQPSEPGSYGITLEAIEQGNFRFGYTELPTYTILNSLPDLTIKSAEFTPSSRRAAVYIKNQGTADLLSSTNNSAFTIDWEWLNSSSTTIGGNQSNTFPSLENSIPVGAEEYITLGYPPLNAAFLSVKLNKNHTLSELNYVNNELRVAVPAPAQLPDLTVRAIESILPTRTVRVEIKNDGIAELPAGSTDNPSYTIEWTYRNNQRVEIRDGGPNSLPIFTSVLPGSTVLQALHEPPVNAHTISVRILSHSPESRNDNNTYSITLPRLPRPSGCTNHTYDPVCGNNVTYINSCYAREARVTLFSSGECDPVSQYPTMAACMLVPEQAVCGRDNHIYRNSCDAQANNISIKHTGPCTAEDVCASDFVPVCGIDSLTYTNQCYASWDDVEIASPYACLN